MTSSSFSDEDLLREAETLFQADRVVPAARILRQVADQTKFEEVHDEILRRAEIMEKLHQKLTTPISEGWTKQGESHGKRDFITYYKVEDGKLFCRIESVIESSLYSPFLCTMNETHLYDTWMPKWGFPINMGLHRSKKLKQAGRVEQIVQMTLDLPRPFSKREIVFWGFAADDCQDNRTATAFMQSVDPGYEDGLVPPPEQGIVRCDFQCDMLFRPCPPEHPALVRSRGNYPQGEKLILMTTVLYCDPFISVIPKSFQNFCTRTGIGAVWAMILRVSEEVRDGKRPDHTALIASKRDELYDWLDERAALVAGTHPSQEESKVSTSE